MCSVLKHAVEFDGKEIEVSGWMSFSFEDFVFGCREIVGEAKTPSSIWISFDTENSERSAAQFIQAWREGVKAANEWKGGAKREVTVRGVIRFSTDFLAGREVSAPFSGFGHSGMHPGEIRVTEIKKNGP